MQKVFKIASSSQTWDVRLAEPVVFTKAYFGTQLEVSSFVVKYYPEDEQDSAYTDISPRGHELTKKGQRPKGRDAGYVSVYDCEGYAELRDSVLDYIEAESGVTLPRD